MVFLESPVGIWNSRYYLYLQFIWTIGQLSGRSICAMPALYRAHESRSFKVHWDGDARSMAN